MDDDGNMTLVIYSFIPGRGVLSATQLQDIIDSDEHTIESTLSKSNSLLFIELHVIVICCTMIISPNFSVQSYEFKTGHNLYLRLQQTKANEKLFYQVTTECSILSLFSCLPLDSGRTNPEFQYFLQYMIDPKHGFGLKANQFCSSPNMQQA